MFPGKKILTVTMALSLVMAILIAGLGAADTTYAAPPTQEAVPPSTAIPYAGQLNNAAGQPVADGIYDFTFSLYDAPTGGDLLWTGTQAGVTVQGGNFSASLGSDTGLPKAVLDLKECWLAVSVRGPDESGFTALEPRQLLPTDGPAAVSALSCPHSHFTDNWSGSTTLNYGLRLSNTGTGDGLRAYSKATAWNYAAVFGANTATTGSGTGVYGYSEKGLGMRAESKGSDGLEAVTSVPNKSAVYAHSANGNGVWAWSGSAVGVHGASTSGRGVEGYSESSYGGYFESANYAALRAKAVKPVSWYAAVFDQHINVLGNCTGCAVVYIGMNNSEGAIVPGDLVAAAGVEVDSATGQPVLQVRRAAGTGDAVIGVAIGAAAEPSDVSRVSPESPGEAGSNAMANGEYLRIMVSGLAQVRVGAAKIAIGDHLAPGLDGAIAAIDATGSVARVLSEPDATGLAWAMVNAR